MLKNLLLLLVSTLLSFAALEASLRVIMPERLAFVPTLDNNESTYEPNQFQRARHLEWDYDVHINAEGFRNDKTLNELTPGAIVALGDSFTEGYGVALEAAYPKLLEHTLLSEGLASHVYNAGHYDTGLPTYRRVYRKIFRNSDDIERVIIGIFVGNDMLASATPPDGRLQLGNEFGEGWKYKLKVFLGSRVATYAALNYVIKTNPTLDALCKKLGACYRSRPPNIFAAAVIEKMIPHTLNFITDFVAEIRADGREALVVIIPTREQVDDALWEKTVAEYGTDAAANRFGMNERLAQGLRVAHIDVVDLSDAAIRHQRDSGERLYFKYDGHWNPAGHLLAAGRLAEFIRREWAPLRDDSK